MSAVLSLPDLDIESILSRYPVGRVERYWPAAHGIENRNFFVQCHGAETEQSDGDHRLHEFVLTIMEHPAYAGDAYLPLMRALDNYGLPVARPLPNLQGQETELEEGKTVLLQRRLTGQHTLNPTIRQIESLGRFVARMHRTVAAAGIDLPAYPRDVAWLEAQLSSVHEALPFTDRTLAQTAIDRSRALLARGDVATLPRGMIHGDLFRDNVLFNEHGLTGVLDFHHAAHGFWIYDLAVIANDWCNDASGTLDPDRTTALLRAYHSVRPLKQAEVWFFPSFALYAAATFWMSRQSGVCGGASRTKDPDEFKRITAHHNRHPFYLDTRLLNS